MYYFLEHDCKGCGLKGECLGKPGTRKRVCVKPEVLLNRPRGLKAAMRVHKSIECLFGDVEVWHRMRRARHSREDGDRFGSSHPTVEPTSNPNQSEVMQRHVKISIIDSCTWPFVGPEVTLCQVC